MAQKLNGRWLKNATVSLIKLAASTITGILATKLLAVRPGVLNFTTGTSYQDIVTSYIAAAAVTDTPQTTLTALGVYVGPITNGSADFKAVLVRLAGTLEGIDDGLGSGGEVYGILTYGSSNYTLSYFKSNGTPYTFPSTTAIDFYFVETQNLNILNVDALISGNVAGVVDASQAQTLAGHLNGGPDKHVATSIQTVAVTDQYPSAASVDVALTDLSSAIDTLQSTSTAVQQLIISSSDQIDFTATTPGLTWNSQNSVLDLFVFINGQFQVVGSTYNKISTNTIQFIGIYAAGLPEGANVLLFKPGESLGTGGTTDLTAITVSPAPATPGAESLGTATNPWSFIYLADQSTDQIWQFAVVNGVIEVTQVGS